MASNPFAYNTFSVFDGAEDVPFHYPPVPGKRGARAEDWPGGIMPLSHSMAMVLAQQAGAQVTSAQNRGGKITGTTTQRDGVTTINIPAYGGNEPSPSWIAANWQWVVPVGLGLLGLALFGTRRS